ncbi:MAG: hypothetical protein VKJ46_01910 [Leptolyngbyaceae bacterium]|nr:hypothetical protein [Leptolyngbyaceae bacterium]
MKTNQCIQSQQFRAGYSIAIPLQEWLPDLRLRLLAVLSHQVSARNLRKPTQTLEGLP